MKGLLARVQSVLDRRNMTAAMQTVLTIEEETGARMANILRYVLGVLLAASALINVFDRTSLLINGTAIFAYIGFTVTHSFVLRHRSKEFRRFFDYAALVHDYVLLTVFVIYWSRVAGPDNFNHALKNPTWHYFYVPLVLSAMQFRVRLILTALGLHLACYYGMFAYGMWMNVPLTTDWGRYVLGPELLLINHVTLPTPLIGITIVLCYITYRSVSTVRRIGDLESRRASLARFFSPDVVDELSSEGSDLFSGVRQRVTILFSDIRGFTKMSEGMDPSELASFLTDFRNRMIAAIFQYGGTVDKFVGDAIMATFGTPRPSTVPGLDTRNAVYAGIAMLDALDDLNRDRARRNLPAVGIGIGIHTGEVFCGTIGSEGRMEYTVIGDPVNTASRIESMCKVLKTDFLISEEVFNEAQGAVQVQKMPLVRVKGKAEPLQTYHVLRNAV